MLRLARACRLIVESVRALRIARWCERHERGYSSDLCPECHAERLERMDRTDRFRHAENARPIVKWAVRAEPTPDFDEDGLNQVRRAVRARRRNDFIRAGEPD